MKTSVRTGLCLLNCVVLTANVPAAAAGAATPYGQIAAANVFRLKPPPPRLDQKEPETPPPPVITLQGITTFPCGRQVLFKVTTPAKPPEPAREVSFVLGEGQREGEIEVLETNLLTRTVKFRNHGVEQTLSLK
jgi:hypothetical protein